MYLRQHDFYMETVTQVSARDNYMLELKFNTGETRIFDARPYLEKGVFTRLKDPAMFKQAYVAYDTVCWRATSILPRKHSMTAHILRDASLGYHRFMWPAQAGEGSHDEA